MKYQLNQEEQDILKSVENGEWKKINDMKDTIERHIEYAKATHRKDKRINIRITEKELELI